MGTFMAFYLLENRGLIRETLQEKMDVFRVEARKRDQEQKEWLGALLSSFLDMERFEEDKMPWICANGQPEEPVFKRKGPVMAWREDAKWLPLFEENLCEGCNTSSWDVKKLAKTFGASVLVFSIFDSDVLFVSYTDPTGGIREDYVKANFEGFEDYDVDRYREEFPAFLCAYGDEQTLRAIWDGEEVFADDRMAKLCEVIGARILYNGEELPEGYERIE